MRPVDADVLLYNTDGLEHVKWSQEYGHVVLVCDIVYSPTLDVQEVKHGKWIDDCSCSICHWIHEDSKGFALLTNYHFCPNCGADMRKETEDGNS